MKKRYVGRRIRRVREQASLTQSVMAESLGVSTSYYNQLERNQRPLTDRLLHRLSQLYDVSVNELEDEEEHRLVRDLSEILVDPVFGEIPPSRAEMLEAMRTSPKLGRHLLNLYRSYRSLRTTLEADTDPDAGALDGVGMTRFPYEDVRDLLQDHNNYFDRLDRAAERLWEDQGWTSASLEEDLERYLFNKYAVRVTTLPPEQSGLRRHTPGTGELALSSKLDRSARIFHLGHQLALLEQSKAVTAIIAESDLGTGEAAAIARVALANYFAGAVMMPYAAFRQAAWDCRHNIDQLQRQFGTSFEQVAHRFSTLQRPRAEGVPFYFLRVDMAGNISKQQTANGFRFARFGGACPLWNVHDAFASPGRILTQLVQLPDGEVFISLARALEKGGDGYLDQPRRFAIGLGCAVDYADQLLYAQHLDVHRAEAATPIGASCRVCPRSTCKHRAFPPVGRDLEVDHHNRSDVPYAFR